MPRPRANSTKNALTPAEQRREERRRQARLRNLAKAGYFNPVNPLLQGAWKPLNPKKLFGSV